MFSLGRHLPTPGRAFHIFAAPNGGRGIITNLHVSGLVSRRMSSLPVICTSHRRTMKLSAKHYATSSANRGPRYVRTLHPEKLVGAGQLILTLSGRTSHTLKARLTDSEHATHDFAVIIAFHLKTGSLKWTPFPANTDGVLYYHNAESQIRFRLCSSLQEFEEGEDLKVSDSHVWNISLARMARNPRKYHAFLSFLKNEFSIPPESIDPNRRSAQGRLVSTFSPQMLKSTSQRIFNISDLRRIRISPCGKPSSTIIYTTTNPQHSNRIHQPFPSNTTGVFYYQPSQSAPTQLGELRFRLCTDIHEFENGSDLCSLSGQPWFISSQKLYVGEDFKSVREHLIEEGLLERSLYPGVPDSMLGFDRPHLTRLHQPFPVDFSNAVQWVKLHNLGRPAAPPHIVRFERIFRNYAHPTVPVFSGRGVAQLEEYPASGSKYNHKHVLALRILELLTPIKRLCSNDKVLDPVPGQLLMHRYGSEYAPWGYSPRNADKRKGIVDWISAQSNFPSHLE